MAGELLQMQSGGNQRIEIELFHREPARDGLAFRQTHADVTRQLAVGYVGSQLQVRALAIRGQFAIEVALYFGAEL